MTERLRILLLGGTGQIGGALKASLAHFADVIAPTRAELDCARIDRVEAFVRESAPHCVVNAAAYTRVDDAETDRDFAELLNAALPASLAAACERIGAGLVHYSTDYVFAGDGLRPYREDDPTAPINWYGATKRAGEEAVLRFTDRAVILRTSWIYGTTGNNFFRTMLRLARERAEVRVVDDQRGAPTWSHAVADGTAAVVSQLGQHNDAWRAAHGIYHMTAGGETTWYQFASRLLELDPGRAEHVVERITPIPSTLYPTPARRPAYSVLDCTRLEEHLGVRLASWERQVEQVWAS
ncbi:dTDP-4-dehydrorhamnose reductase [soil metagenome]